MKTKNILCGLAMAVVLQLGMLAGSAQTNLYLFSGSKTNISSANLVVFSFASLKIICAFVPEISHCSTVGLTGTTSENEN
jgi:hypothetical protein